jgi:hypothetical protein
MHSSVEQPSGHTSTNEAPRSMKKALVRPAPDEGGNHPDEGGNHPDEGGNQNDEGCNQHEEGVSQTRTVSAD